MNVFLQIFQLVEKLLLLKYASRQRLYEEILQPMHATMLDIHKDYIQHFMAMRNMIPPMYLIESDPMYLSQQIQTAKKYIEENQKKYAPHRLELVEKINVLDELKIYKEEKEYVQTSLYYLKLNVNEAIQLKEFSEDPALIKIENFPTPRKDISVISDGKSALTSLYLILHAMTVSNYDPKPIVEYIDTSIRFKEHQWRFVCKDFSTLQTRISLLPS